MRCRVTIRRAFLKYYPVDRGKSFVAMCQRYQSRTFSSPDPPSLAERENGLDRSREARYVKANTNGGLSPSS